MEIVELSARCELWVNVQVGIVFLRKISTYSTPDAGIRNSVKRESTGFEDDK